MTWEGGKKNKAESLYEAIVQPFQWTVALLVVVTVFDVVTRRFFVLGSVALQEAEWHLHAIFLLTAMGYGYLKGGHVRIDLFSQGFSPKISLLVELLGFVLFMLPLSLVITYTGLEYVYDSYISGESSGASNGIPHRFLIKSMLPLCGVLLLAAACIRMYGVLLAILTGQYSDGLALLEGRDRLEASKEDA